MSEAETENEIDTPDTTSSAFFRRYDRPFQEKIFQALLSDRQWAAQMVEVMTPDYFEVKYLHYLTEKYFEHYKKHRTFPTLGLIATIARDDLREGNAQFLRQQIIDYLHRIKFNPDVGDLPQVKEMTLVFCRTQALKEALGQAVNLIEQGKHEQVVGVMREAVAVGIPTSIGHDFHEDFEARFQSVNRRPVATGLPALDKKGILNGGLGRGEIGIVVAPTGVGKSHWLVHIGGAALLAGKNVIHYTFELTETSVGVRYDSYLTNIPSNDVIENKEFIKQQYDTLEMGNLIIKEYPTGYASVITIKSHVEKLMMRNFVPHVIIVDYADIMRSTRRFDSMRHELKLVYEELRNLAQELNIPVWTASQANREAANSDIVGLENMSEAYGKAMVADVVISLSRKAKEKSSGFGRLFIAKNRAGRDGIVFPIKIDTARSQFEIFNPEAEMSLEEALADNEHDVKSALRKSWNEIKNAH